MEQLAGRSEYLLGQWAGEYLGMAQPTGVEVPEAIGQIGGQSVLYDNETSIGTQKTSIPRLVFDSLVSTLRKYCVEYYQTESHEISEESIKDCARELMALVGSDLDVETEGGIGEPIRELMFEKLSIPKGVSNSQNWGQQVNDILGELRWNISYTVRSGIGQGVVQVTPLAVARYVSALVNGGTLYEAHLIERVVDPQGVTLMSFEPTVTQQLDVKPENLAAIKQGMKNVVSLEDGGTGAAAFKDFAYVDQIGGKTGTAQISSATRNIDIQNTSWMVAFAPYDEPEIVVVVAIPNGWKGSMAAPTVRGVIDYWMTRKNDGKVQAPEIPNQMMQ